MSTGIGEDDVIAQLLVLWQQPSTRALMPVAELSFDGREYRFEYLPSAVEIDGFRPLPGFRDFDRVYTQEELFPLFQERILDPSRDDFERVLEDLELDPARATPWEQLVRSGGGSEGDTVQVTPLPCRDDEGWKCITLVNGLRYFLQKTVRTASGTTSVYTEAEFESVLDSLEPGDQLAVKREIGNQWNPNALLFFTDRDQVVGYVPDWLVQLLQPTLSEGESWPIAHVERVNGASVGWHLRLLVSIRGNSPLQSIAA
jgi:hypothetical protein